MNLPPMLRLAIALWLALFGPAFSQSQPAKEPGPATVSKQQDDAAAASHPAIPPSAPLQLSPNEPYHEIKRVAGEIALALSTYDPMDTPASLAERLPPVARDVADALHVPGAWSRGRVIYPQFGGLLDRSASVMVVLEQTIGKAGDVEVLTRVLDVRVVRTDGQWRFAALASTGGDMVTVPVHLLPEARAVLDDPRIVLSDSARWDILDGTVSPRLLGVLAQLADQAPFAVASFDRGHPWGIFGTDRQSDHSRGRAADIYRIGDRLVIDDRAEGLLTHRVAAWLFEQPDVARIGSPFRLNGFGSGAFTDALHQDHLHVAVDG